MLKCLLPFIPCGTEPINASLSIERKEAGALLRAEWPGGHFVLKMSEAQAAEASEALKLDHKGKAPVLIVAENHF